MNAGNRFERVRAAIEQIGPADHVCTLYDERDEEVAIAVSYIRAGLDRGEFCVCVVDDGGQSIRQALAAEGVDVDAEVRKGRMAFFEKPMHPLVIIGDRICRNPYYVPPDASSPGLPDCTRSSE